MPAPFSFLARAERVSPSNLTVREQARLAENPNETRWQTLAPRKTSDSIKLTEITTADWTPIAGRREWNSQARDLPDVTGVERNLEIMPLGSSHTWGERELQLLREKGRSEVADRLIKQVDEWGTKLADSADWLLEAEFFESWANNRITVRDPKRNATVQVAMGVDSSRYVTEPTPLNDPSVNAFQRLCYHLKEANKRMGSVRVVRLRQSTMDAITADAPAQASGLPATVADVEAYLLAQRLGVITFAIDERTYPDWTGSGGQTTEKHFVPAGKMLFQPAGGRVGYTHFVDVTRAEEYLPSSKVETRQNVVIFWHTFNEGKSLKIEGEAIALPLMEEKFTYVVDAGV